MKKFFKKILQYYLKYVTKIVLFFHHPLIIAVAGSTNKTFVRYGIAETLARENYNIRSNQKSFNTEIGLPLSILNLPSGYNSYKTWWPVIIKALRSIGDKKFPKILILELGVDRPGDMKYLMTVIKPSIVILTDITQRYLESFADMDQLVNEYKYLVSRLDKNDCAIMNYDNLRIRRLAEKTESEVIFYGIEDNQPASTNFWLADEIKTDKHGQKARISHNNYSQLYKINRYGLHHIYALLIKLALLDRMEKISA